MINHDLWVQKKKSTQRCSLRDSNPRLRASAPSALQLYRLARCVYSVLSTEANAERAFSKAGAVLCAKRTRLGPDIASAATVFGMEYKLFAFSSAEHATLAAEIAEEDENEE